MTEKQRKIDMVTGLLFLAIGIIVMVSGAVVLQGLELPAEVIISGKDTFDSSFNMTFPLNETMYTKGLSEMNLGLSLSIIFIGFSFMLIIGGAIIGGIGQRLFYYAYKRKLTLRERIELLERKVKHDKT